MAYVDYERAYSRLRAYVVSKGSHGQNGLLAEMGRIEVECAVPEGQEVYDGSPPLRRARQHQGAVPVGNGASAE